jgi:chromosome segregation ATPase
MFSTVKLAYGFVLVGAMLSVASVVPARAHDTAREALYSTGSGWFKSVRPTPAGWLSGYQLAHAPELAEVDSKQQALERRITDLLASGRISAAEAAKLRAELGQVASLKAQFMADGHLNFNERSRLLEELDHTRAHIDIAARYDARTGPQFANPATVAEIEARQAALKRKITDLLTSGKWTSSQAAQFLQDLDRIEDRTRRFRRTGQGLTEGEANALKVQLAQMESRVAGTPFQERAYRIDVRQDRALKRISDGLASGQLTAGEAASLRAEFDRILQLEARFKADGKLTSRQYERLREELADLNNDISAALRKRSAGEPRWRRHSHRHDD